MIRIEQVKKHLPELPSEPFISVRYYNVWETVYLDNLVNKDLNIFHGHNLFLTSSEIRYLSEFVKKHHNDYESVRFR